MVTVLSYIGFGLVLVWSVFRHVRATRRREAAALATTERSQLFSGGPRAHHPHIDAARCIGCGACVDACPEGEVLGVIGGKAAIVDPHRCVGHGLCADACPVGAIEIVMASPSVGAELPVLSREHETSVPNLFIAGELGGLALIKNAINEGRDCVDVIAARLREKPRTAAAGIADVCIVGAGPGGISASLRAIERGLKYLTLEQDEFGGTVAKYPRRKLVLTSPVDLPLHGRLNKLEISKEHLLRLWTTLQRETGLAIRTHERVNAVTREADDTFTITTTNGTHRARAVVLALGRRGTPRKLGVEGEGLPKVMYDLIETEAYSNSRILVVGGGDSAVEAAMGLAHQPNNEVTLSYRRDQFARIKERNAQRLADSVKRKRLQIILNSEVTGIDQRSVRLAVGTTTRHLPNDFVWVFAGGTPPKTLLEESGIAFGTRDLTAEAGAEIRLARATGAATRRA